MIVEIITTIKFEVGENEWENIGDEGFEEAIMDGRVKLIKTERLLIEDGEVVEKDELDNSDVQDWVEEKKKA